MEIPHMQGMVNVTSRPDGRREIRVRPIDPQLYVPRPTCVTSYSEKLIKAIVSVKGAAYVCDEIARDEDPHYIEQHLVTTLFSFVEKKAFAGKRLLDFGCGCGASTMILARHLPDTTIVGVDLEAEHLNIAKLRAENAGYSNIEFFLSPSGDTIPSELGTFDFIFLPAVYEHLLPLERTRLTAQLWAILKKDGVLFIDETPHRWFPIETHTTGLPFINYLPDAWACAYAQLFSHRNLQNDLWETLLRKGIRGSSWREIHTRINAAGGEATLLSPLKNAPKNPVQIWAKGYAHSASKRFLRPFLSLFYFVTRIPLVPYLSLAIRKKK